MSTPTTSRERGRPGPLSTADLAAASRRPEQRALEPDETRYEHDALREREAAERDETREQIEAAEIEQDELEGREAAIGGRPAGQRPVNAPAEATREALEPLFASDQAEGYRNRWLAIQSSFVDDPRAA